ncbi:MAG: aspartate carbamoyltransferase regulatory subunit [Candidatus Cloacimonetes bacterium]|jgi:aspartate carbamoyltransferase regulatory subunit|nr:aspartate carbamoyltransferase regulatory subunit [Candidatus Cloacimonadota bacterium]MBT4332839.1 aspartate carbamoyltransferase regulatory subunit [Candidatus Cloacimonadota bacterium]MBT4575769.1 aspartate carbamoyltransferase regulatory subunit [Candidatus Cloacimonadota bacterium]MBT5421282.1 aspartate carbamoyltransferase regulatory subunit [Candidatus Cloacimonadota bacterium]
MSEVKKIKVNAIKNGTVIDHISAGKILKVIDILNLTGNNTVMVGMNLSSNKIGKKDIIKIENRELSKQEVNSIALIAPSATLIIINDFEVVSKASLDMPEYVEEHIICPNPKCITNSEEIPSKYYISNTEFATANCLYCEKKYLVEDLKIKI